MFCHWSLSSYLVTCTGCVQIADKLRFVKKNLPIILCTSMIKFWNINYHYHFSSDDFLNSFALLMPTCTLQAFIFYC